MNTCKQTFFIYIKFSGMYSQWTFVCEWKESSSHYGLTEVNYGGKSVSNTPWMMNADLWFFFTNFHLGRILLFVFFVSCRLLKLQPGKLSPVGLFFVDGLIVKTNIVQSNFLSYVQCSRMLIKVVHYWMIAAAKNLEISFHFFGHFTSLKLFCCLVKVAHYFVVVVLNFISLHCLVRH